MVGEKRGWVGAAIAFLALLSGARAAYAQESQEIVLTVGSSTVVTAGSTLSTVTIGNPDVADVQAVSATEVLVNAVGPGSTTLILFEQAGPRSLYTIRVTVDVSWLQRQYDTLFPEEAIEVTALGRTVILSGTVRDPLVAQKAQTLAGQLGENVQVLDNLVIPDPGQVLLQVRFAEVSRSWLQEIGPTLVTYEGENVAATLPSPIENVRTPTSEEDAVAEVFSDAVNFFIFHDPSGVAAFIRALQTRGLFRSLAEPNLLAMPAESASFLAGGEFPFPVLQGGGGNNAVTIQFKEFGVRLNFVPRITNSGAIRLWVAPEVSSLDFANGLTISGFNIPSLLSRKAETVIELQDGQTFAIAGLVDNSLVESISKVPLLGDIPILGELFKSREMRQNRSELLVLVTPRIVQPLDQSPPLPTGEPGTWKWDKSIRQPDETPPDDGTP
ncbi:MAG: type II and III secretion system protein family protein [Gemmatimonadota bacterium]